MRIRNINQNSKLSENLNNGMNIAELSFMFGKNTNHGNENNSGWIRFEPTRFIYLFQTFNTIYDYDWCNLNNNYEINENTYDCKKDEENNIKTRDKIQNLHRFIKNNSEKKFIINHIKNYLFDDENNEIINNFKKSAHHISHINKDLEFIFKTITNKENWDNECVSPNPSHDFILTILKYFYRIRNNFFHGNKTIESLLSKSQLNRIEFYNKILEAYIDCFFLHLKLKFNYNRITKSDLDRILEN